MHWCGKFGVSSGRHRVRADTEEIGPSGHRIIGPSVIGPSVIEATAYRGFSRMNADQEIAGIFTSCRFSPNRPRASPRRMFSAPVAAPLAAWTGSLRCFPTLCGINKTVAIDAIESRKGWGTQGY
jgi:hypothetical protein